MHRLQGILAQPSTLQANQEHVRPWRGQRLGAFGAIFALLLGTLLGSGLAAPTVPAQAASPSVQTVVGTEDLLSIACPTTTTCLAVGDNFSTSPVENVIVPLTIRDTSVSVGPVQTIAVPFDLALRGIACPTSTTCLTVGAGGYSTQGVVVPLTVSGTSIRIGQVQTVPGGSNGSDLDSITCPTSTGCLAVGSSSSTLDSAIVNKGEVVSLLVSSSGVTVGTVQTVVGPKRLEGVSCPTSTSCLAAGSTGDATASASQGIVLPLAVNGTSISVGSPQTVAATKDLHNVACPTTTTCLAAGDNDTQGMVVPLLLSGSTVTIGTVQAIAAPNGVEGIGCPTSTTCLASGGNSLQGVTVPLAVSGSTTNVEPIQQAVGTSDLSSVVCPTSTSCLAVGANVSSSPTEGVGVVVVALLAAPTITGGNLAVVRGASRLSSGG